MLRARPLLFAITLILSSSQLAQGISQTASQHPSGIALVDLEVMQARPVDEKQAMAFNFALQFAMDHPDDFGYPWIDPASGVIEISSASPEGTRLAPSIALTLGDAPSRTRQVEFSYAELGKIADEITHIRGSGLDGEEVLFKTEPDEQNNRLIVTIDKMHDGLMKELASRYGTTAVAVRVDPNVPNASPARHHDFSPFWGGAQITTPNGGGCSSGFAWSNGANSYGMLTAAHCAPNGGSFSTPAQSMGSVTAGSGENWQAGNGTVPYQGESINRGDVALIWMSSGKSSAPYIYRGGAGASGEGVSPVRLVWGRWSLYGDTFCLGGFKGGELCGYTVVDTFANVWYSATGEWARNVTQGTKSSTTGCFKLGDSGGSVFTIYQDGVAAKGIFSGGGDWLAVCHVSFTDIQNPVQALPGTVSTLP
jgi:hypothetical protein